MKLYHYFFLLFLITSVKAISQNTVADSLIQVFQKTKNDIDKAQLLNSIATAYGADNPKLMEDYAEKALQLSKKIKYRLAEGNASLNKGNVNIILGNYGLAF